MLAGNIELILCLRSGEKFGFSYSLFCFCFCFRDIVIGIISLLQQCSWIMKSAENRCAFVRAEFVQILILLSQHTSSYRLHESHSAEEPGSYQTAGDVAVDDGVGVDSDTVGHVDGSNLFRCLDETINSEMRLLLESDGSQKHSQTHVTVIQSSSVHCSDIIHESVICKKISQSADRS